MTLTDSEGDFFFKDAKLPLRKPDASKMAIVDLPIPKLEKFKSETNFSDKKLHKVVKPDYRNDI